MAIIETNKMAIEACVIPAPQRSIKVYPVKDAYISKANPFYPFGIYNTLSVQNSETNASKALMVFEIPDIDPVDFSNLLRVTLTLHAMYIPDRDVHLLLKYHQDDGWPENGITWAGQPIEYPETICEFVFPAGAEKVKVDLLNIIVKNGIEYNKYAFSIVEDPAYGEQSSDLSIGSREALISNKAPEIKYTYAWYPDNYDIAEMNLKFQVLQSLNKDLPINFGIINGYVNDDLYTRLSIRCNLNAKDLNVYLRPRPIVFDRRYKINMRVKRYANKNLNTRLHVKGFNKTINLPIRFNVKGYTGRQDIGVSLNVRGAQTFPVWLRVPKYSTAQTFNINFAVRKTASGNQVPSFPVTMTVNKYTGAHDLNANVTPRFKDSSEFDVYLRINSYKDSNDFNITHTVRPNGEALIPLDFHVKGYESSVDNLILNMKVKSSASLPVIFYTNLYDDSPFNINMRVRPSWMEDVVVNFKTVKNTWKSYAFIM